MILATDPISGAYREATLRADCPVKRWTALVEYRFGPAPDDVEIEEIDVDAATVRHAREVAEAALKRDYESGGKIVHVDELHGVLIPSL